MGRENELGFERRSLSNETALEPAERLGHLLTLSYEAMLAWRLDGPIQFWNAGAEQLYGFAQNEAVGRSSHALLQTKFPIDFAELRSQLRAGRHWSGELRHIRKDGSEVLVESRMQLFSDGIVLEAHRDITQTGGIETALRAQNAEYAAKRQSGRIQAPTLRVIKPGEFARYRQSAKRDSQFKTVRLTSDAEFAKRFAVERQVFAAAPQPDSSKEKGL